MDESSNCFSTTSSQIWSRCSIDGFGTLPEEEADLMVRVVVTLETTAVLRRSAEDSGDTGTREYEHKYPEIKVGAAKVSKLCYPL